MTTVSHLTIAFALFLGCGDSSGTAGAGAIGGQGGAGGGGAGGTAGQNTGGAPQGGDGGAGSTGGAGGAPTLGGRVFVTSATYDGVLGGIAGADQRCQMHADAAGLGGTFRAWLSDTQGNGPLTTFAQSAEPYELVGGDEIAANWADLIDGSIATPINRDETGTPVGDVTPVAWTGTQASGMPGSPCCDDWSSTASGAWHGSTMAIDAMWSFQSGLGCTSVARLYCFEQ